MEKNSLKVAKLFNNTSKWLLIKRQVYSINFTVFVLCMCVCVYTYFLPDSEGKLQIQH